MGKCRRLDQMEGGRAGGGNGSRSIASEQFFKTFEHMAHDHVINLPLRRRLVGKPPPYSPTELASSSESICDRSYEKLRRLSELNDVPFGCVFSGGYRSHYCVPVDSSRNIMPKVVARSGRISRDSHAERDVAFRSPAKSQVQSGRVFRCGSGAFYGGFADGRDQEISRQA